MAARNYFDNPFLTRGGAVTPPPLAARVYYAYQITVNNQVVGTFQSFNPTSNRPITRVRGVVNRGGWALELVPGPADIQITVNYLSLYSLPLARALFYNPDESRIASMVDLNYFIVPFDVKETCFFPDGQTQEQITYGDCMISAIGRTITQANAQVAENATIQARYAYTSQLQPATASAVITQ